MNHDTQIIYGNINRDQFTWNGWIYYRTETGRARRRMGKHSESVNATLFTELKAQFEDRLGYKVNC